MHWLRCEHVTLVPGHEICSKGTCGCWDKLEGPLSGLFAGTTVDVWDIILPRALNDPTLKPNSATVMQIIGNIQAIETVASEIMRTPDYKHDHWVHLQKYKDPHGKFYRYDGLMRHLNRLLAKHETIIKFPQGAGAFGWKTDLHFLRRTPEENEYKNVWEQQAVKQVISLAERGLINRVRQCRKCTLWFFAKVHHQKFCSAKCREQEFVKSPAYREKRRRYMTAYRSREKVMSVSALTQARKSVKVK